MDAESLSIPGTGSLGAWPRVVVTDDALTQVITDPPQKRKLVQALGELGL